MTNKTKMCSFRVEDELLEKFQQRVIDFNSKNKARITVSWVLRKAIEEFMTKGVK